MTEEHGVKFMDSVNGIEVTKTGAVTGLSAYTISMTGSDVVMYLTITLLSLQIISILWKFYKENRKS